MGNSFGKSLRLSIAWTVISCGPLFAQITDSNVYVPPDYLSLQPPAVGQTYSDPVFGTTIRRITDARNQQNADSGGNLVFITDEYSSMSPFNQNGTKMLLLSQSYFALYDGSGNFVKNCPMEVSASSEPRWSRTNPDVVYYLRGNQLKQYNTSTNAISVVQTFSEYSTVSGKGESDICFDGNHFVLVGNDRYVFVYELSTGSRSGVLDTGGRGFDSVYITPDDNVTVTWFQAGTARYNGIELYDRNMRFLRQVSRAGGHMDVTRDANGDEVLVLINAADPTPACDNAIVKIRLSDGRQTCLASLDWSLAVHISAPDNSGFCFVETYAPSDPLSTPAWKIYTNEILQVKLDGTEVRRLAHHRSRPFNSYNYQPHVSASRDGRSLVYNSNFGLQASQGYPSEYSDVYMITVPGGTGGTTPPPSPPPPPPDSGGTPVLSEEGSPAVTWAGSWFENSQAGHSGGSARLAMDAGSRAVFSFSGTQVSWIGYRDEWSGVANVYVDGRPAATVDTYASPAQSRVVLFTVSGLASGNHSLTIEASGNRNPASGGSWVWIDAFEVLSASAPPPPPSTTPPPPSTAIRFEENSPAVSYRGSWFDNRLSSHSGSRAVLAMDAGSRATFTFSGTGATWIAYRDQWSGIARIFVDGVLRTSVDTYASTAIPQAVMRRISGLARGTHTLTVEATGRKRSASRGSWVWVDAFDRIP